MLPTLEGREAPRNTGGVPFSTLRCCVPGPTGGSGPPATPGRGPCSRGPPASFSPGPRPEGAALPASRTTPASPAGARSASVGPAPPRPPSCADATRPRPLAPLPPRPGDTANGGAEAGRIDGSPRGTKGCGRKAAGVLLALGPCAPTGSPPAPRRPLALGCASDRPTPIDQRYS